MLGMGASREDGLHCQGDSWVTSTGPTGTWEMFQVPSRRGKAPWVECEEPTLDTGGAEHAWGAGRVWGGWERGTSVGGIFLFVVWLGGGSLGEGVCLFLKFMSGGEKKVKFSIKAFFCLFFLQASDGHRVGFHILCWLFE